MNQITKDHLRVIKDALDAYCDILSKLNDQLHNNNQTSEFVSNKYYTAIEARHIIKAELENIK